MGFNANATWTEECYIKTRDEWLAQVIRTSHIDFPLYSLKRHLYSIGTHCTEDWVGPTTDMDIAEKSKSLATTENRTPSSLDRPANSQTLY